MQDYLGRSDLRNDVVSAHHLRGLAATLDVAVPDRLPPLWHWTLFQEWLPPRSLGADGHPRRGGFIPPLEDLTRRMYAGGRVTFLAPLHADDPVTRKSTIKAIKESNGSSGRIVFVTIAHEITGPGGLAIHEEQDLAYLSVFKGGPRPPSPSDDPPSTARCIELVPDPLLLFRYSSLTANCHRIHYDLEYATGEEDYPGLVVHGPLQATLLAGLAAAVAGTDGASREMSSFSFRALRPAFHGRTLRLQGWAQDERVKLRSLDHADSLCIEAEAAFRQ